MAKFIIKTNGPAEDNLRLLHLLRDLRDNGIEASGLVSCQNPECGYYAKYMVDSSRNRIVILCKHCRRVTIDTEQAMKGK